MSSFEAFLGLEKHASGDETWLVGEHANFDAIGYALHGQRVMYVDPNWTLSNVTSGTPSDVRRRYSTIQAAIDAAEGEAWDEYLILLSAGTYSENLTIASSVTIASASGSTGAFYPNMAKIRGVTTVADSVITIAPADSTTIYAELIGISLENNYNQENASEITEPYLIDCQDQGAYPGTRSKLVLRGCPIRMQTWGGGVTEGGNKWTYGIKAKGQWHVIADGCQITTGAYGGGEGDGVLRRLFDVRGNNAQSITAQLNVKRCDISNPSYDDGTAPILFYMDDRAHLIANHCSAPDAVADLYVDGGTGTQVFGGVDSGDYILHSNAWGVAGTVVL